MSAAPVPLRRRLLISIALGLLAGIRTWRISLIDSATRDFDQVWFAAKSILAGLDPYLLVGPHLAFDWPNALYYPLPAAVAVMPLTPLSPMLAACVFTGIGGAFLAWALMEFGYPPLLGFASSAVVFSAERAQWSPLLTAGIVWAPVSLLWVAKPTIGAAMFVSRPSWWPVAGAVLLGAISFFLQPYWLDSWRHAVATTSSIRGVGVPYIAPVMMPGGFIALLALLRWRRPEARLIAAMACVPQTLLLYEAVPLFLVPRTLRETELLFVLSYVALALMPHGKVAAADIDASGKMIVLLLYLPATFMVLRRPNEGAIPHWLEGRLARSPRWLRGNTSVAE